MNHPSTGREVWFDQLSVEDEARLRALLDDLYSSLAADQDGGLCEFLKKRLTPDG